MAEPIVAIEFHDAGLVLVDAAGVRATSPSVAVEDGGRLRVGAAAAVLSRRNPRRTLDRFWAELDQDPLPVPAGTARSHADVAYFHLRELWETAGRGESEVLLAVPAAFDRARLALLLGIVRACEIPVAGVVEASVAAAATVDDPRPRAVVELGLHRATLARIGVERGLVLEETRTIASSGLAELREIWVETIAARFLRETRFDALHDAGSEQLLHDRLPEWLARLAAAPVTALELPAGQRRVRIELTREALVEPVREIYRALGDAAVSAAPLVHVGPRLGALPGFLDTIRTRVVTTVVDAADVGRAAIAHAAAIRSDGAAPAFVTRLPGAVAGAPPPAGTAGAASALAEPPTHLLVGDRALAIAPAPLWIDGVPPRPLRLGESAHGSVVRARGSEVILESPAAAPAFVNGRPVEGEIVLHSGDAVRTRAGVELRLIVVEAS